MSELRSKRVEELIAHEIGSLIISGDIKDPRVSAFVSVTRVEAAKDFSQARVFVSTFEDESALANAVAGLNRASGYIQSVLGKRIKLRLTPRLSFVADSGVKDGFALSQRIDELTGHDPQ